MQTQRFAIFDLDLTLTTRHLWMDLFYHRRSPAEVAKQDRAAWVADLGGPENFQYERLESLFQLLQSDGFRLGLATYNHHHIAVAFLRVFGWLELFTEERIMSRDNSDGNKATFVFAFAQMSTEPGLYFDDSATDCQAVKSQYPDWRVFHMERPLSAPDSTSRELP